jgi:voltage-gated potassium channel Kch
MNAIKRYFRDTFIILSAVWINVILFFVLMTLSAGLLKSFGNRPQASWLELILDAFHFSTIERVDTGGKVVPILLAFILPILSAIILGEGILRVFSIYMQRGVNRKEWNLMVVKTYKDHALICGVGEMGQQLLRRLAIEQPNMEIVLIDPRPGLLSEMGFMNDRIIHLQGNMTDMDMLKQANLPFAKMVILTAGEDALNLETAYKVLQLNPEIPIWIRLHRSGLAGLLDLARKPQIHFFCPYQQAAESIMNHIMGRETTQ